MSGIGRPPSFADSYLGDWEAWVLENGLPQLPASVAVDEAVPVAYWRSGGWAAVLNLSYAPAASELGEPVLLDADTQSFRWTCDGWEVAGGSGGTNWFPGLGLGRPPQIGPRDAFAIHRGWFKSRAWTSAVLDGVAGVEAETVEVDQAGHRRQQTLDSPIGAWVVAFDGRQPATVRVRAHEAVLYEEDVLPRLW